MESPLIECTLVCWSLRGCSKTVGGYIEDKKLPGTQNVWKIRKFHSCTTACKRHTAEGLWSDCSSTLEFSHNAHVSGGWVRGQESWGGPLYFHPLRCQILEEASDEALSAWRREITPTRQRYGTAADWLHNPSNHAKPQLSSDTAPRRSAASSAARHPSTNKACCCLLHTWTLRPNRRIWTRRQTSPSACFGSSALVASSSNRAPSVGRHMKPMRVEHG